MAMLSPSLEKDRAVGCATLSDSLIRVMASSDVGAADEGGGVSLTASPSFGCGSSAISLLGHTSFSRSLTLGQASDFVRRTHASLRNHCESFGEESCGELRVFVDEDADNAVRLW